MKSFAGAHGEIFAPLALCSDEILSLRLRMKLNPPFQPDEVGFHREAISSTAGGFIPP